MLISRCNYSWLVRVFLSEGTQGNGNNIFMFLNVLIGHITYIFNIVKFGLEIN